MPLEGSSYPPGQYVVPPRGNRSTPVYPVVGQGVAANSPQTPSLTGPTIVLLDFGWAAAAASANQVTIEPQALGGGEPIAFPEHAAADATTTHTQITFLCPAGAKWRWTSTSGTPPTVIASYVPVNPTTP